MSKSDTDFPAFPSGDELVALGLGVRLHGDCGASALTISAVTPHWVERYVAVSSGDNARLKRAEIRCLPPHTSNSPSAYTLLAIYNLHAGLLQEIPGHLVFGPVRRCRPEQLDWRVFRLSDTGRGGLAVSRHGRDWLALTVIDENWNDTYPRGQEPAVSIAFNRYRSPYAYLGLKKLAEGIRKDNSRFPLSPSAA